MLFQRLIPDFVPSDESYGVAVASYEQFTEQMAAFGLTDPEVVDVWTALLTGLTDQQISNDPGGDRGRGSSIRPQTCSSPPTPPTCSTPRPDALRPREIP
ncbi:MAG: hypothetical protein M5T61_17325 [Acidimicrobiia bacterium]|nr:hypothetical protein [Acidimicrobiia bacterium]